MQDSKGFCISEGRIGGWVQGSIITTEKSNWLVGQCMKTADVFRFRYQLFVAMQSIYLPVLSTKVQSFTGRTAYEKWFIGKQTDSARYSWKPYPNLAVSRLGSKVCKMTRFQRVLHFWRPNWWMSPGFDNYNRESSWLVGQCMKTADVFWFRYQLFVAMQSIYHPALCTKVQLSIDRTAYEKWFIGMQTDSA